MKRSSVPDNPGGCCIAREVTVDANIRSVVTDYGAAPLRMVHDKLVPGKLQGSVANPERPRTL